MHLAHCVCAEIPHLPLQTRIVLVAHYRELTKTTSTGPLALHALPKSELVVHGSREGRADLTPHAQDPDRQLLVLFPSDDATVLTPEHAADRPVSLVVPEGTWAQASRMVRRLPGLEGVPSVILPEGASTAWHIRREPRHGGLATLEAIARALGILESSEAQQALETLLARVVEETRITRQHPKGYPSRPAGQSRRGRGPSEG
jgi:DTW domain-containing protein YfiP